jgi:hypothetical protein
VPCTVQWVDGRRCGVRFVGQFQTQQIKPRRLMTKQKEKENLITHMPPP